MTSGGLARYNASNTVVVRDTNPKIALWNLQKFVRGAGIGAIRTVHINTSGTLLVWFNGTALAAQYYPALACGRPAAAVYVWWMLETLGKPKCVDVVTIAKAEELSIDLTA